ncbi:MAG TPA: DUF2007 domain-containing protein [Longimicrobiales bacterium]|nr:DUF2007 domain-containing protein [Longimicrobiales bacterium]
MSDRIDRKLEQVAVGQFTYRHEAEFAAGFLADAGIPYRLQADDAGGDLGLTLGRSATLWVLAVDAERAREVLDLEREEADDEEADEEGEVGE